MTEFEKKIVNQFVPGFKCAYVAFDPEYRLEQGNVRIEIENKGFSIIEYTSTPYFRYNYEKFRQEWDNGEEKELIIVVRDKKNLPIDVEKLIWRDLRAKKILPNLPDEFADKLPSELLNKIYHEVEDADKVLTTNELTDVFLDKIVGLSKFAMDSEVNVIRFIINLAEKGIFDIPILKELIIILKIPEKFRESLGINAKILSSTNTFYDWLNKKWQIYATSIINKGQPYLDFSNIKTEIAGLLSLGLLSPVETKSVDLVDVWFSNWIRRKVLEIDEIRRLREELSRKIDKLHDFVEWFSILRNISELELRIDDRDVEIINEFIGILDFIDEKFSNWYLSSIGEISNRSPYYKPWTVDQVLNHLRMRYGSKICLVVIDALSYFSWLQFRDFLVKNGYLIKREELILTWIPTITEICRKSLLSGKKVRDLIKMNSKTEDRLCLDFWRNYVEQDKIAYLKFESGKPWGVSEEELEHEIIAIVINQIDDIVHTSSSYQELNERLRQCFERIHPVINKISKLGFNVFITSDHGFRRCTEKEYYGKKTFINTKGSRFFISERKEQVGGVIVNGSIVGFKESEYIHLSCNSVTYSKFEKIFDHGGITVQECIIPFVEVSTLEEVG